MKSLQSGPINYCILPNEFCGTCCIVILMKLENLQSKVQVLYSAISLRFVVQNPEGIGHSPSRDVSTIRQSKAFASGGRSWWAGSESEALEGILAASLLPLDTVEHAVPSLC